MTSHSQVWNQFSKDYDSKVFSLTSIPQRRKQILDRVGCDGHVLNVGTGSTPYLNLDLIRAGNKVTATDFCPEMIEEAYKNLSSIALHYVVADTRNLPFDDGEFDSVVSTNSILPPERSHIDDMVREIHRVLKPGGRFVAFLPSFDSAELTKKKLLPTLELDFGEYRVNDTLGWQCFHTPETIHEMLRDSWEYELKKVHLRTKKELSELARLYGVDTSSSLVYEYLLTADKL